MTQDILNTEWQLLQKQSDQYEAYSLLIKLIAIVLLFISLLSSVPFVTLGVFAILWLQDAIWKTFQSRTEARLIEIEKAVAEGSSLTALQFNYPFSLRSRSLKGLITEYVAQALRPTNALIHLAVMAIFIVDVTLF